MVKLRSLKNPLQGFLRSFTSRYVEIDGYWLIGFLVGRSPMMIDLLEPSLEDNGRDLHGSLATRTARRLFMKQLEAHGVPKDAVLQATLSITTEEVHLGDGLRPVRLRASASTTQTRRAAVVELVVRAWPHDPRRESQSVRATASADE